MAAVVDIVAERPLRYIVRINQGSDRDIARKRHQSNYENGKEFASEFNCLLGDVQGPLSSQHDKDRGRFVESC